MTAKHLGEAVHDLLDGRLRGDRAYTAMAHLGECEACAARFHELRTARDALASSQAGIDMRFAQQLLNRDRIAEIAASEGVHKARATRPPRRAPLVAVFTVVILGVVVIGAAWRAGAPAAVALEFAQPHEGAVESVAYADPQGMRSGELLRAWIHPDFSTSDLVPVEAAVIEGRDGQLVLVASILAGLEPITVVQQHGRLPESLTAQLPRADVAHSDVYVVESSTQTAVMWQTGDVVVALSCTCAVSTLEDVAEEFPRGDEPGFVERIADGMETFVEAAH